MNKFKSSKKKNNKVINLIVIIFLIITFFASIIFAKINNMITNNMSRVADKRIEKFLYSYVTNYIYDTCLKENNYDNLIKINYKNNEITSVDYDLKKTYVILNNISNALNDAIKKLEKGTNVTDTNDLYLKSSDKGLILFLPLGIMSNKIYLTNLGPKIPVKIIFIGKYLSNIKTKVTSYGINNGLLEIYVTLTLSGETISPVNKNEIKLDYDILIAAKVVEGKVPNLYGYENILNNL